MATIQGTVKDALGNFARRLVRLHRKYDGALAGEVLSNPSSGEFSISTSDQTKHYAVVHDQDSWLTYLPFNGANNDTVFSEWGGKPITANGGAKISTTESKFGGSAAYFDGSGDYLTTPANPELAFGSLDFTIEAWVRLDAIGTERAIFDSRAVSTDTGLYLGISTTGYLTVYGNNATLLTATGTAIAATTWAHVALVKSSDTMTLYLNGVSVGSAASSYMITCPGTVVIGRKLGSVTNDFNGYIDDLRIQKGKAQYVGNFNVPTVAHYTQQDGDPYWNNVVLACHFDGQPDNGDQYRNDVVLSMRMNGANGSTAIVEDTGKVVTVVGNAQLSTAQKKYGTASCYFDGTGDYLSVSNTLITSNDFTVEGWFNVSDTATRAFFAQGTSANTTSKVGIYCSASKLNYQIGSTSYAGVTTLSAGWHHFALTRAGTSVRLFLDGVIERTDTVATAIQSASSYIGSGWEGGTPWLGYLDDVRVTNGVARYTTDFTPPAAELPALQRAFPDVASGKQITAYGDAKISATQSKFGGYSAYFDGSGDYLALTLDAFGTGDFAVEGWLYVTTIASGFVLFESRTGDVDSAGLGLYVRPTGKIAFITNGATVEGVTAVTANVWHHVLASRVGGVLKVFLNGTQEISGAYTNNFTNTSVRIGALWSGGAWSPGYVDDVLVYKGVGKKTVAFTPPTSAFPEQLLTFGQKNALIYDHLTPV